MVGKRVQFDSETWASIDLLSKDRMMTFQELADEAFRDILGKYNRPSSLKEALRKSAGVSADIVTLRPSGKAEGAGRTDKKKARKRKR